MELKIIGKSIVPDRITLIESDVGCKAITFSCSKINDGLDVSVLDGALHVATNDGETDCFYLEKVIEANNVYYTLIVDENLTKTARTLTAQVKLKNDSNTTVYNTALFIIDVKNSLDGNEGFSQIAPSYLEGVENNITKTLNECKQIKKSVEDTKDVIEGKVEEKGNEILEKISNEVSANIDIRHSEMFRNLNENLTYEFNEIIGENFSEIRQDNLQSIENIKLQVESSNEVYIESVKENIKAFNESELSKVKNEFVSYANDRISNATLNVIENVVTTVNGEKGNVVITPKSIGALQSSDLPTELKNPHPLNLNGVLYDGSQPINVTMLKSTTQTLEGTKVTVVLKDGVCYTAGKVDEIFIDSSEFSGDQCSCKLYFESDIGTLFYYSPNIVFKGDNTHNSIIIDGHGSFTIDFYIDKITEKVVGDVIFGKKEDDYLIKNVSEEFFVKCAKDTFWDNYCVNPGTIFDEYDIFTCGGIRPIVDENGEKYHKIEMCTQTLNRLDVTTPGISDKNLTIDYDREKGTFIFNGNGFAENTYTFNYAPGIEYKGAYQYELIPEYIGGIINSNNAEETELIQFSISKNGKDVLSCAITNKGNVTYENHTNKGYLYDSNYVLIIKILKNTSYRQLTNYEIGLSLVESDYKGEDYKFLPARSYKTEIRYSSPILSIMDKIDYIDMLNGQIVRNVLVTKINSYDELTEGQDGMACYKITNPDETMQIDTSYPYYVVYGNGFYHDAQSLIFTEDAVHFDAGSYGPYNAFNDTAFPIYIFSARKKTLYDPLKFKAPIRLFKGYNHVFILGGEYAIGSQIKVPKEWYK